MIQLNGTANDGPANNGTPAAEAGGNLIYSAPTSAGKTLVAELLVLKKVLESGKKAIIVLPFVSVCREKMLYLQNLFQDAGVRVDGYYGCNSPVGDFSSVDVAVCTIERANSLINRLLEENKLSQLGILVIDELHMLGDSHRGYLLELIVTKVRFACAKALAAGCNPDSARPGAGVCSVQIVGMSATLPNLDLLARWLHADLFQTQYRPVSLQEMVKVGRELFDNDMRKIREVTPWCQLQADDDHVVSLCLETVLDGHMVLVFCPTKNWCEKLAETVAREFTRFAQLSVVPQATSSVKARDVSCLKLDHAALRDVREQLKNSPAGLDDILAKTVPAGVAFHHAGLTFDERDIVEGGFRHGALRVLIATSTLSSGVNLPARRVIIRTPMFHGSVIDVQTYRQMIGRAGRKGLDSCGESIILCKPAERSKVTELVRSSLLPVRSCFSQGKDEPPSSSMKRAILEIVVSGVASCPDDVAHYASCTLLAAEQDAVFTDEKNKNKMEIIYECIEYLLDNEFITLHADKDTGSQRYVASQFGCAAMSSSLSPDESIAVYAELRRARQCFVLENEMHLIYLVTPVYVQDQWVNIDWYQYYCCWEQLPADMRRVAEVVGVKEDFLSRAVQGKLPCQTAEQHLVLNIHRRFYAALVLNDLVNEVSLNVIVRKYGCQRGALQSLQQAASTFAGMVTVFCGRLGWRNMEMLLAQFQSRLNSGVQPELMDLVRISLLNAQRARVIYDGGYQTIAALAKADVIVVETLIRKSLPFQMRKKQAGETEWEAEERGKWRSIWLTGEKGLTECEAAILVVNDAKALLQKDLAKLGIEWKPAKGKGIAKKKRSKSPSRSVKQESKRRSKKSGKDVSRSEEYHSLSILTPPFAISPAAGIAVQVELSSSLNIQDLRSLTDTKMRAIGELNNSSESKQQVSSNGEQHGAHSDNTHTPSTRGGLSLGKRKLKVGEFTPPRHKQKSPSAPALSSANNHLCEHNMPVKDTSEPAEQHLEANLDINLRPVNVRTKVGDKQIIDSCSSVQQDSSAVQQQPSTVRHHLAATDCELQPVTAVANHLLERPKWRVSADSATFDALCSDDVFAQDFPTSSPTHENNIITSHKTMQALDNNNKQVNNISARSDENDLFEDSFVLTTQINQQLVDKLNDADDDKPCKQFGLHSTQVDGSDKFLLNNRLHDHSHAVPLQPTTTHESSEHATDKTCDCSDLLLPASCYDMLGAERGLVEVNSPDLGGLASYNSGSQSLVSSPCDAPRLLDDAVQCQLSFSVTPCAAVSAREKQPVRSAFNQPHNLANPVDSDHLTMTPFSSAMLQAVDRLADNNIQMVAGAGELDKSSAVLPCSLLVDGALNKSTTHDESGGNRFVPPTPSPEHKLSKLFTPLRKGKAPSPDLLCSREYIVTNEEVKSKSVKTGSSKDESRSDTISNQNDVSATAVSQDNSRALAIIDVTSDKQLFNTFIDEWKTKPQFSISVAWKKLQPPFAPVPQIGGQFVKSRRNGVNGAIIVPAEGLMVETYECNIVGLAVSWEHCDAYYINLLPSNELCREGKEDQLPNSLAPPPLDTALSLADRVTACLSCLCANSGAVLSAWDLKTQYKLLAEACGLVLLCRLFDPSVADWLLNPSTHHKTIQHMVTNHLPSHSHLLADLGSGNESDCKSRVRACVEAVLVTQLTTHFSHLLCDSEHSRLYQTMLSVEMPALLLLANMELSGFGFSQEQCDSLRELLQVKLAALEQQAYELAGHSFSLTSPDDISKVLYVELRLPASGDPDVPVVKVGGGKGGGRGGRQMYSTAKDVLEKLRPLHPLPGLILEWRRIANALSKVIFPLQNAKVLHKRLNMYRIYGNCEFHTATGRVTMAEPNLQNVPKDFDIQLPGIIAESPPSGGTIDMTPCRRGRSRAMRNTHAMVTRRSAAVAVSTSDACQPPVAISMRHIFVPFSGGMMLAADYSQLELRIIAHLSGDRRLIDVLNGGADVFKMIAAQWQGTNVEQVTVKQRQHAKGICYGIIYGITAKGLSEQLNVSEDEAEKFMDTFKNKYTSMRKFLREVVQKCRERGYVETLLGRKRYLPGIKDTNVHARAHAERQAINTTIQGSAADLVKTAMVRIDSDLRHQLPKMTASHRHRLAHHAPQPASERYQPPRGAYLVLQLHDELIYEVNAADLATVSHIIQHNMENAMTLSVKLPVKIKIGPTWGKVCDN